MEIIKFTTQIDLFHEKWLKQKAILNDILNANESNLNQRNLSLQKIRNEWNELLRQKERTKYLKIKFITL